MLCVETLSGDSKAYLGSVLIAYKPLDLHITLPLAMPSPHAHERSNFGQNI